MSNAMLQNLGDAIFGDIDSNPFLNELYDGILYNYAIAKFDLTEKRQMREIDIISALRFADLLSKSTSAENKDKHKMWAQEIIILLNALYPDNEDIKFYAGSVFANTWCNCAGSYICTIPERLLDNSGSSRLPVLRSSETRL